MNMMEMAAMEEAIEQAFERPEISQKYGWARSSVQRGFRDGFHDGFRAGVEWARQQDHSALASYMVGGVALIATERVLQIEDNGWTPEHDDQHINFELIQAAGYYCAYDAVAAEVLDLRSYKDLIEDYFPSSWADRWKKRNGFPDPTDMDLAKAGALIAAELDRRARQRERERAGFCQPQTEPSSQAVGNISQYPAAVEEPEEEA